VFWVGTVVFYSGDKLINCVHLVVFIYIQRVFRQQTNKLSKQTLGLVAREKLALGGWNRCSNPMASSDVCIDRKQTCIEKLNLVTVSIKHLRKTFILTYAHIFGFNKLTLKSKQSFFRY